MDTHKFVFFFRWVEHACIIHAQTVLVLLGSSFPSISINHWQTGCYFVFVYFLLLLFLFGEFAAWLDCVYWPPLLSFSMYRRVSCVGEQWAFKDHQLKIVCSCQLLRSFLLCWIKRILTSSTSNFIHCSLFFVVFFSLLLLLLLSLVSLSLFGYIKSSCPLPLYLVRKSDLVSFFLLSFIPFDFGVIAANNILIYSK